MYPTAIVVLVELHRSLWETDEVSRELTGMHFAPNPQLTGAIVSNGSSGATFDQSRFSRKKGDLFERETVR